MKIDDLKEARKAANGYAWHFNYAMKLFKAAPAMMKVMRGMGEITSKIFYGRTKLHGHSYPYCKICREVHMSQIKPFQHDEDCPVVEVEKGLAEFAALTEEV